MVWSLLPDSYGPRRPGRWLMVSARVLLVLVLGGFLATVGPSPASAAPTGEIVGVQLGVGIFGMSGDGAGRHVIEADPGARVVAAAPNESAIAYADSASSTVHVASPYGLPLTSVTLPSGVVESIAWSPQSGLFAFTDCAGEAGPCALDVALSDGTGLRTVVAAPPSGSGVGPVVSWGLGGLVAQAVGSLPGCPACQGAQYAVNLDGSFAGLVLPLTVTQGSPGGALAQAASSGVLGYVSGVGTVHIFPAAGSSPPTATYSGYGSVAWSPDGHELVLSNGHQVLEVDPATGAVPQPIASFSSYGVTSLSWATPSLDATGCSVALAAGSVQGIAADRVGSGYWITDAYGSVSACGSAIDYGGVGLAHLNKPVVSIAAMPDGSGYRLGAYDGGVLNYGAATAEPGANGTGVSLVGQSLSAPVWAIATTPDGAGYWLATTDGHVYTFGDAAFFGPSRDLHLVAPLVAMAPTPDGRGYWLTAADGGVFTFGDAVFSGSLAGRQLHGAIVGMAADPAIHGAYWLVGSDGTVYAFGGAPSLGSVKALAPVRGMAATADGRGYWVVDANGHVFAQGDAPFAGSANL